MRPRAGLGHNGRPGGARTDPALPRSDRTVSELPRALPLDVATLVRIEWQFQDMTSRKTALLTLAGFLPTSSITLPLVGYTLGMLEHPPKKFTFESSRSHKFSAWSSSRVQFLRYWSTLLDSGGVPVARSSQC